MDSNEIFRCDQCLKAFNTLGRYNQHLKTHSKPFQCGECVRGFALRSDLTRHVQARHRLGLARHACIVTGCSFRASRKDNIRQHLQSSHPQIPGCPGGPKAHRRRARLHTLPSSTPSSVPSSAHSDLPPASTYTLMQAAWACNIGLVQTILRWGIDISAQAEDGNTVLHCAVKANQVQMISPLIELGARSDILNKNGRTPLHEAILDRRTSAFNVLLEKRVDVTENELRATIETSQTQLFQKAWVHCDKNMFQKIGRELFDIAANSIQTAAMATLLLLPEITQEWIDTVGRRTVSSMIPKDQIAMLDCLLKSGKLDPNMYGVGYYYRYHPAPLLHLAVARGCTEIVDLLLKSSTINRKLVPDENTSPLSITALGDQVKTVEKLLQCPEIIVDGNFKWIQETTTPLHLACRRGHVEVVRLMLKAFDDRGLNVDSPDRGFYRMTPLQQAVVFGHTQAVELLLLRQDIDVNRFVRSSSMSLWQLAAHGGHAKTLSVLLGDSRVNRDDAKNSRQSLLFEATSGGHWGLVDILLNYGKVPFDTTRQDLSVSKEPFRRHVDILERYLIDVALLPTQQDSLWHGAARNGNLSLAMVLLEHAQMHDSRTYPSVDVNRKNAVGNTPLHVAVDFANVGIVELLLHHEDIDIHSPRKRSYGVGVSAIDIAISYRRLFVREKKSKEKYTYMIDLLLAHGARSASHERVDKPNLLSSSLENVRHQSYHSAEQTEDLRWGSYASRASVVEIQGNGTGSGETGTENESLVGEMIPLNFDVAMEKDPDAAFEEFLRFDDEAMSDDSSLEMLQHGMYPESSDQFTFLSGERNA